MSLAARFSVQISHTALYANTRMSILEWLCEFTYNGKVFQNPYFLSFFPWIKQIPQHMVHYWNPQCVDYLHVKEKNVCMRVFSLLNILSRLTENHFYKAMLGNLGQYVWEIGTHIFIGLSFYFHPQSHLKKKLDLFVSYLSMASINHISLSGFKNNLLQLHRQHILIL